MARVGTRNEWNPRGFLRFARQRRNRTRRITTGPKLAEFGAIRWICSIMDVRLNDASAVYRADIARWAVQLLNDSRSVVERVGSYFAARHRWRASSWRADRFNSRIICLALWTFISCLSVAMA
ncbi:hypothetical protein Fuma_02400 [Fuerstiella marisgermanici]|uniref:Uncharacterized protein n=1 Tax=Fuerstiella marisgermanici TaxID=1891926 RepID=A0A1P8WFE5_9PLAN|nr:hypothetical protein Fuma_02400 [Fuerstiella marisgermanici]